MKRALYLAFGSALVALPVIMPAALQAQTAAKAAAPAAAKAAPAAAPKAAVKAGPAAFVATKNAWGQPDLGGFWTNATITREMRPANVNGRAVYTPEEIAREEGIIQTEIAVGNKASDPKAGAPTKGGDKLAAGIRPELAAGGGAVGGYDRGWLDTGSAVMRVHGEARTSILTTVDGRYPARKPATTAPAGGGRGGGAPAAAGGGRGGGGAGRGGAQTASATPPRVGINGVLTETATGRVSSIAGVGGVDNPEQRSLGDRCILAFGRNAGPPMLANGYYNNNYTLQQGKDSVAIMTEMVHDTRIVRLNGKHRSDGVRPYFGDSVGHYEGMTLVVETTNIPQAQAYAGSWENLTVTEKFTRVAKDRLLYQFSIHDPSMWDADWGGEYEFASLRPGQRVEEYACHEGNYAMEDILAGARADDAAAKTTAQR